MANENKFKNLNIAELKKQNKKLDEKIEGEVLIGDQIYKISIDKVFRKSKQYALLDDVIDFINESGDRIELLDLMTPYMTLLMIKHFTSVNVPDDVEGALEILNVLIDLDALESILNLLPEEETTKLYELLTVTTERMKNNIDEIVAEVEATKENLENQELKDALDNGTEKE